MLEVYKEMLANPYKMSYSTIRCEVLAFDDSRDS